MASGLMPSGLMPSGLMPCGANHSEQRRVELKNECSENQR